MIDVRVKLTRELLESITRDLKRPHPVAHERVGFAFGRKATIAQDALAVVLHAYEPVADEHYMDDPDVGARISGDAIRAALQRCLSEDLSVFHVHAHFAAYDYDLGFSPTDLLGYQQLLPSFRAVARGQCHGALVLDARHCVGIVLDGKELITAAGITVVGFPLSIWSHS